MDLKYQLSQDNNFESYKMNMLNQGYEEMQVLDYTCFMKMQDKKKNKPAKLIIPSQDMFNIVTFATRPENLEVMSQQILSNIDLNNMM